MTERTHAIIDYQLNNKFQMKMLVGWYPAHKLRGPQYYELTIRMTESEGLALVIFVRIEK
jgi:hypothetical protein